MNYQLIKKAFQNNARNFGTANAVYDLALRAVSHVVDFKILKCVTISTVAPQYLSNDTPYTCRFLSQGELYDFAQNEVYKLTQDFLGKAVAKGDECFGILDGGVLASYGWYSNTPTDVFDGLSLHFNTDYIYMYKGYTHNNYRGQRLHAIGMSLALQAYLERGFKGLVSNVEATNFSSLKSCYRMGYTDFGNLYLIKTSGRYLTYSGGGCKDYGVWAENVGRSNSSAINRFEKS